MSTFTMTVLVPIQVKVNAKGKDEAVTKAYDNIRTHMDRVISKEYELQLIDSIATPSHRQRTAQEK